jgi:replication factor C subunit 1
LELTCYGHKLINGQRVKESPTGEETSTTDYFATKGKPKQTSATSAAQKAKQRPHEEKPLTPAKSTRQSKESASTQGSAGRRGSARKQKAVQYVELDDDELEKLLDDDMDTGDDIFAADVKKNGTNGHDEYVVSDDDGGAITKPRKTASRQKVDLEGKAESSSKDVGRTHNSGKIGNASTPNKKRKSAELDSDDGEDFETGSKQTSARKAAKRPAAKKSRPGKEEPNEDAATQAILDSITTIKAPSPPPRDADKKFDWRAGGGGNAGPPPAAGAKEIPEGAENCLAGLTFVFTGLLETISRDEAQDLVKRYGGRVTGAPSSKTSYVVLGSDAGPSKLEKIKSMNIKTINEDGLFELVRRLPPSGGSSKAAEKEMEKKRAEEEKAKRNAAEMAKEERRLAAESEAAAKRAAAARGLSTAPPPRALPSAQLWTSKYAPTQMNQICGNKGQVEKIQKWLEQWHRSRRRNFELAGADGTGKYRAIIIHGPPGIGKFDFFISGSS